jgi:hypothetical protein
MRGCSASQVRVEKLEWLERLSVMTAISPVGLACSTAASSPLVADRVARGRGERDRLAVAGPQGAIHQVFSRPRPHSSGALMRWPSVDQPGEGGKLRGMTGPSSSAQITIVCGGGAV